MLPVQDALPSRTTPWITLALIAAAGVLALIRLAAPEDGQQMIVAYGAIPAHFTWTTLLSSAFLHYGAVDAVANLWALWIFGDNVEDRMGHGRFLVFVLCCGALAFGVVRWLVPDASTPVVGMGGLVGGVIGAYVVLLPASRVLLLVPGRAGLDLVDVPAPILSGFWLLGVTAVGVRHADADSAIPLTIIVQIAGVAAGVAAGRAFCRRSRLRCEWWNVPRQAPPVRRRTSRDTSANSVSSASN